MDTPPTVAFTNELLILPATICDELQQPYRLPFVLFFEVVQPQYFQENQDTSDLQKFNKVSASARTRSVTCLGAHLPLSAGRSLGKHHLLPRCSTLCCQQLTSSWFTLCSFQTLSHRHRKPHVRTQTLTTLLPHRVSDPVALEICTSSGFGCESI